MLMLIKVIMLIVLTVVIVVVIISPNNPGKCAPNTSINRDTGMRVFE